MYSQRGLPKRRMPRHASVAVASAVSQASPLAPYVTPFPTAISSAPAANHAKDPADTGGQRRIHGSIIDGGERRLDRFVATAVDPAERAHLEDIDLVNPSPVISSTKPCAPAHGGAYVTRCARVIFRTSSTTVCDASYCASAVSS
jgi:hypothetical protein